MVELFLWVAGGWFVVSLICWLATGVVPGGGGQCRCDDD